VFNFVDGYYSYNNDKDSSTVIGYLCEHMEARLNWLATEWGCDVTLRERVVDAEALTEKIFTFKGYSFSFNGRMAVGYDINYDLLERYETVTGISLEIGVTVSVDYKVTDNRNGEVIMHGTVNGEGSYFNTGGNTQAGRDAALSYASRKAAELIVDNLST
jgi:hypothetical protein